MPLSWNEIKSRATQFSKERENETSEDAEAKTFWNEFFHVFGINRRRVVTFEERVTKNSRQHGKIDLLWKGQLLVEHKSAGKDLDRAHQQLDKAVDLCSRHQPFTSDTNRMEYLFELYDKYTNPLIPGNERWERKIKK